MCRQPLFPLSAGCVTSAQLEARGSPCSRPLTTIPCNPSFRDKTSKGAGTKGKDSATKQLLKGLISERKELVKGPAAPAKDAGKAGRSQTKVVEIKFKVVLCSEESLGLSFTMLLQFVLDPNKVPAHTVHLQSTQAVDELS